METMQSRTYAGLTKLNTTTALLNKKDGNDDDKAEHSKRSGYHGLSPLDALALKHRDLNRKLNLRAMMSKSEDNLQILKETTSGSSSDLLNIESPASPAEASSPFTVRTPTVHDPEHYFVAQKLSSVFGTPDLEDETDFFDYFSAAPDVHPNDIFDSYNSNNIAESFDDDNYYNSLLPPNAPYYHEIEPPRTASNTSPTPNSIKSAHPAEPPKRPAFTRSATSPDKILPTRIKSKDTVSSGDSTPLSGSSSSKGMLMSMSTSENHSLSSNPELSNSNLLAKNESPTDVSNNESGNESSKEPDKEHSTPIHPTTPVSRCARPSSRQQTISILQAQSPFLKKSDKERANLNKTMVSINKSINIHQSIHEISCPHHSSSDNCLFILISLMDRLHSPVLKQLDVSLQSLTMTAIRYIDLNYVDVQYTNLRGGAYGNGNNSESSDNAQLKKEEHLNLAIHFHLLNDHDKCFWHTGMASSYEDYTATFIYGLYLRHGLACSPKTHVSFLFLLKTATQLLNKLVECLHSSDLGLNDTTPNEKLSTEYNQQRLLLALILYELGVCFMHGWGITRDRYLALHLIKLSGAWGDADAQFEAGLQMSLGAVSDKDSHMAAYYYRLAGFQGISPPSKCKWVYKSKYSLPANHKVPAASEVAYVSAIVENLESHSLKFSTKPKAKLRSLITSVRYL